MTTSGQKVDPRLGEGACARRRHLAFLIPLAGLSALLAWAAFRPDLRLWGINHLSFYHPALRYAALALVGLTFLSPVATRIHRWITRAASSLVSTQRGSTVAVGVFAASIALFLSCRSATQLLGDGQLQAKLISRLAKSEDVDFGYFADFVAAEPVAPATDLLNFTAARTLKALLGWEPIVTWQVIQSLFGGFFVLLWLAFLRRSRIPMAARTLVVTAGAVTGAAQLFFGYIETYTPMIVAVTAYLLVSFRSLHGKGGVALPTGLFALAVVFHLQALLLAPSVFFLIVSCLRPRSSTRVLRALAAGLIAATFVGAAALALAPGFDRFFLPVFAKGREPGVLSLSHMLDVINQLLLVIPFAPFVVGSLIARSAGTAPGERAERTFALLILVPCALFLFFFRPELGMARDWDLFVLPAAGFAVFGLTAAKRFADSPASTSCYERYLAPALAAALAIVVPWVGINASERRSVQRYETVISMDAANPGYGLEILAMHYGDQGDQRKKAEAYDKAFAVSKNPRYLVAACSARLKYGEIDATAEVLRDYLEKNPGYHLAREVYIEALARQGDMDGVIRVCREGIERDPERWYYHFYLGVGHFTLGNTGEARSAFEECLRRNPPAVMVKAISGMMNAPAPDHTTPSR